MRRGRDRLPEQPVESDGRAGGSLPPPSFLGLGPDASLPRDWLPTADELDPSTELPDRPPTRVGRSISLAVPIVGALLLIGGALGVLLFNTRGPSDEPTSTAPAVAGSPFGAATGGSPVASPDAPAAASTAGAPTAPRGTPTTGAPADPTIDAGPPIRIAVSDASVAGVAANEVASVLADALRARFPGRLVELTPAEQAGETEIVVGAELPTGYETRTVAIAPLALVVSPRLPLVAVSLAQADRLLAGEIQDWRDAGSPVRRPVELLAVGSSPGIATPAATFPDTDQLLDGFADHPGGVALIPIEEVDPRVNLLAVDGIDPLRDANLTGYPYGARLVVAVRAEDAAALLPIVDDALASFAAPSSNVVRIALAGAVVPGDAAADRPARLAAVAPALSAADLTIVGFDGAIAPAGGTPTPTNLARFAANASIVDELTHAGVDCLTLATEHALALGPAGLVGTRDALAAAGIAATGAGATLDEARVPCLLQTSQLTVAILAVDAVGPAATDGAAGTSPLDAARIGDDVQALIRQADVVIVVIHIADDGRATPPRAAVNAARAAIDGGATAVIVDRPRLGGMEYYRGRPLVYGLGVLAGDATGAVETRQGAILELTYDAAAKRLVGLRLRGVETDRPFQPRLMSDAERAAFHDRLWSLADRRALANG